MLAKRTFLKTDGNLPGLHIFKPSLRGHRPTTETCRRVYKGLELSGRQNEIVLTVPIYREAFSNYREGFSIYREIKPGLLMEIEQFHLEAERGAWRYDRRLAAIAICDGGRADNLCLFTLVHLL